MLLFFMLYMDCGKEMAICTNVLQIPKPDY
jgi:hypothetical protein